MNRPFKVCLIAGYRPSELRGLRGGGGPNAVSAPLIDAFAKMHNIMHNIQITVISMP